jgi:parvulin-like peptidyl-prolyl isomerase
MSRTRTFARVPILATLFACAASAQGNADEVLARNATITLTRGDYEQALLIVPEDKRLAFATNPQRVEALLNQILVHKTLAAQARAEGLDQDPAISALSPTKQEGALVAKRIEEIEHKAEMEFDAKGEANLAVAREDYVAHREQYREPERVLLSDIEFSIAKRGDDAAFAAADAARAKLTAGFEFAALARSESDDAATRAQGGRLPWVVVATLDPATRKAVEGLTAPGAISQVVRTSKAYHLLRLEERRAGRPLTFDEAKDEIIRQNRLRYVQRSRESVIAAIRSDPSLEVNQDAIDALVVVVDPEGFKPKPVPEAPAK